MFEKFLKNRKKIKLTKIPTKDLTTLNDNTLKNLDLGKKLQKLRPDNVNSLMYKKQVMKDMKFVYDFFTASVSTAKSGNHSIKNDANKTQVRPE